MPTIEVRSGTAAELHMDDPFADGPRSEPVVWVCDVTAPALVLGSRQEPGLVDLAACAAAGIDVAARRSGGGAVLLRPGAVCWIDVILPHGIAPDDVRGSMVWIGEVWREALVVLGAVPERLDVHRTAMTCTPWSDLVCFAGFGPGEIVVGDRKLVGVSQRRTRHGLRMQCQAHRVPLVGEMPSLFAGPVPAVDIAEPALLGDVLPVRVDDGTIADAVATVIAARTTTV